MMLQPSIIKAAALTLFLLLPGIATAGIEWNDRNIQWYGYIDGMLEAKRQNKSMFIVIYTDWCGYCKKYSRMFYDDSVVNALNDVIPVRINADDKTGWAKRNGLNGSGVPRTFAINKSGEFIKNPYTEKSGNRFFSWTAKTSYLIRSINYIAQQ